MKKLFSIIAILTGLTAFGQTWHPDSGAKFPGATEVNELTTQKILLIGEDNLVNSFIEADSLLQAYATETYVQSNFASDEQGALADTALQPGDNNSGLVNDSGYLTSEANDLAQSVIWTNVPDANITQSSVTQHEAALTITQSQIPDLQHVTNNNELTNGAGYLINEVDPTTPAHVKAISTTDITNWNAAEPNVNADWGASSGDAEILNKPTTIDGYGITDANLQNILENGSTASIPGNLNLFTQNISIDDSGVFELLNGNIKVNGGSLEVDANGVVFKLATDSLLHVTENGLLKLFGGITSNDGNFNEYFGEEAFGNKEDFTNPSSNTAVGSYAMFGNPNSAQNGLVQANTAVGISSLYGIKKGYGNVAIGGYAMYGPNEGDSNVAIGLSALQNNTTGGYNVGVGYNTLLKNNTGILNTAMGSNALANITNPDRNIAIGVDAMKGNTSFSYVQVSRNTAVGIETLLAVVDGKKNTAIGDNALRFLSQGDYNTALGHTSLFDLTSGIYNLALGTDAGKTLTTGSYNVYIGSVAASSASVSNEVIIGDGQGNVVFKADGASQSATIPGNLTVDSLKLSDLNTAPTSATAVGTKGEIRLTAGYIYVCIATDTWVRAALSTW